ncbi:uncharacterized protein E0L32_002075 [Thyridium curvatum]|uniref:Apple domain-containing protein n=1 Tax=Thyridium curvatum TaxID=1093900 RepID=A0A507AFP1_9PEZI|nr:uncharacterized protein E0L32_002058 [Thyridium curvatum]XP_030989183.1 uncharacterized protein E0L32_002075 [Thyridium curvatum]TPX07455.1 hypothetical protein E0L32_002058 [Thyridium curvatum]TPX07472.1 hypothetical protein E0L32_002075 [Thyridium curvatum]
MAFKSIFALVALAIVSSFAQNLATWVSTSFITEKYSSWSTIKYGSEAVTPVAKSTSLSITTLYTNEAPTTSDKTVTTWFIGEVTVPTSTYTPTTILSTPLTVTSNGTSTITKMVSPCLATVTLSPTSCASSKQSLTESTSEAKKASLSSVVTVYTGTYTPSSGQVMTTPTAWATAVTTYIDITASYRVVTQVGYVVTTTITATGYKYLATGTLSANKTITYAPFKYTSVVYLHTATVTSSDWYLAYTTKAPAASPGASCSESAPTVTRVAPCAPSNLISQRDGHGVAVRFLPRDWRVPVEFFPPALLGIPGMDASACCQLCFDNAGCAASEWSGASTSDGCKLYYYGHGDDTCGVGEGVELEYYADTNSFPGQASYLQLGCGQFKYIGRMNPFCPDCEVTE